MDAYGHVNNTVFFRYFESARVRYLERCGFADSWARRKIGAILHSTSCRFRRPLFYPDIVYVAARATRVDEDRFTMAYALASESQQQIVAEASGVVVSYDYAAQKVVPIPDDVRQGISDLESSAVGP
jgi:acyl-CoA thioester hydrolase